MDGGRLTPGDKALAFLRKYRPAPWFLSFGKTPSTHKRYEDAQSAELVIDVDRAQGQEENTWFRVNYAEC